MRPPDVQNPGKEPYNFYRYTAKRFDPASGSYDMGFRDYNPGLNRFLTRDTYNGALADLNLGTNPWTGNRYAFTGGNPVSNVELDGHCAADEGILIGCATLQGEARYEREQEVAENWDAQQAEQKWIKDHSPKGDDPLYIVTLWDAAADPMSGTDEWNPEINPDEGTLCFGRIACREATRHLTETQGKDLEGAKRIAATYCLDNLEKCVCDSRTAAIAAQVYYSFLSALFGAAQGTKLGPKRGAGAVEPYLPSPPSLDKSFQFPGAGRSGAGVKNFVGPKNSVVRGASPGRVFVTDDQGRVIWDITRDRVKPVVPGQGFVGGHKLNPTGEQLGWINELWGK